MNGRDVSVASVRRRFADPRHEGIYRRNRGWPIQGVPRVNVTTLGFNSRADSESNTSHTHGSNSQRFRIYGFLKYSK